jgi:hypothetical protein
MYVDGVLLHTNNHTYLQRASSTAQLFFGSTFRPWSNQKKAPALLKNMTFYNEVYDDDGVKALYDKSV